VNLRLTIDERVEDEVGDSEDPSEILDERDREEEESVGHEEDCRDGESEGVCEGASVSESTHDSDDGDEKSVVDRG